MHMGVNKDFLQSALV